MMKAYKDLAVPPGVDRNLEALRAAVARGAKGCAFSATSCTLSDAQCLGVACPHCICEHTHRDVLKEYLNKTEKENSMAKEQLKAILKPGMVIRTAGGQFFLWIGGSSSETYVLDFRQGLVVLADCDSSFDKYDDVDVVYAYHTGAAPAVCVFSLVNLMQGKNCPYMRCVWKRPEPVKEMTVDEISKALGYKVKVVGNEKADD